MGWTSEKYDGSKVEISDEVIDLLWQALADCSSSYEEDLGRKPKLKELLYSLQLVLSTTGQDVLCDLTDHTIIGICVKLAAAAKRPKFEIGDYFAIPISKDEYYYGRILYYTHVGHLMEFYDVVTRRSITLPQLLRRKTNVLFYKHVDARSAFRDRGWRVIGHRAIPKTFEYPAFYMALGAEISQGNKTSIAPSHDVTMKLEPIMSFDPKTIEDRIREKQYDNWPEIVASKRESFPKFRPPSVKPRKSR